VDNQVAVIGLGQTEYRRANQDQNAPEMVLDAVEKALADAGLELADMDGAVTASIDLWDGRTASNFYLTEVVGSVLGPETRVAGDGLLAVFQGAINLLAGAGRTVLVVAVSKGSEADHEAISNWVFDPVFQQPLGLDYVTAGSLQAQSYLNQYHLSPAAWTWVVVKNRAHGAINPRAMLREAVSLPQASGSPLRASPLRDLDVALTGDGACALVLAHKKAVDKKRHRPVWIKGLASALGAHYLGDRKLFADEILQQTAARAYQMAGLREPDRDLDVIELSEFFAPQELIWTESLGLCPPGGGATLMESGQTSLIGSLPINPSGGLLSGTPLVVAGMARVMECVLQLRGEAGPVQIEGASTALAHGTTGPCGQGHGVIILGR
jgi:acetyl-CoA C-acetyltransferase